MSTPGTVRDEVLEPRGRTAFTVDRGQTVRIVDLEGQQVADFVCFRREDPGEKLSVHNTALIQGTVYITTGHALLSDRCGRLMTITEDTCGRHDLLAGSCSEGTNRVRYGIAGTPNCRSNFEAALRFFGIPLKEVPYSFNVFMNVPIEADGKVSIQEPISRPAGPRRSPRRDRPDRGHLQLPPGAQPLQRLQAEPAPRDRLRSRRLRSPASGSASPSVAAGRAGAAPGAPLRAAAPSTGRPAPDPPPSALLRLSRIPTPRGKRREPAGAAPARPGPLWRSSASDSGARSSPCAGFEVFA